MIITEQNNIWFQIRLQRRNASRFQTSRGYAMHLYTSLQYAQLTIIRHRTFTSCTMQHNCTYHCTLCSLLFRRRELGLISQFCCCCCFGFFCCCFLFVCLFLLLFLQDRSLLYSAILRSRADSRHLHVILHECIAFFNFIF